VTYRDPHELTTNLFPSGSSWSGFSAFSSSVDFMVKVDGVSLTFTSGDLSESLSGMNGRSNGQSKPGVTFWQIISDSLSHVHNSISTNTGSYAI
jgi:hypothetical protein